MTPPTKNKGKGKAPLRSKRPVEENDGGASESGLEYDEDALLEESDDSGSEFVASDEEVEFAPDEHRREDDPLAISRKFGSSYKQTISDRDEDSMDDDEDVMVNAAIQMSLQITRPSHASSSSNNLISPNPVVALRAAATERRLTRAQKTVDADDFEMAVGSDDASASDSEEEPLSKKGKGSFKGNPTKKAVTVRDTSSIKAMTMTELRRMRRDERQRVTAERRKNKKEELALMKQLGRRLTYVSLPSPQAALPAFVLTVFFRKAEKSTIALQKEHPELKDVWGDLEANIPIVIPQRAEQPANLKLTMLPFQLESLFWMRNQEKGIWNGGMLAVCQCSHVGTPIFD